MSVGTCTNPYRRLVLLLILGLSACYAVFADEVKPVNGPTAVAASLPTVLIVNGTGYIPLQAFAQILGAEITPARTSNTLTYNGISVTFRTGSNIAKVGEEDVTMPGQVFKRGDAHYVPFKSVVRALEMNDPTINMNYGITAFTPIDAEEPVVLYFEAVPETLDAFQDQDTEVYLAAIDGKTVQRMTYDLSDNSLPSVSPDGKMFIYAKKGWVVGRFFNSAKEFVILRGDNDPNMPPMLYMNPHYLKDGSGILVERMINFQGGMPGMPPPLPGVQPGMNPADMPPNELMMTEADGQNPRVLVSGNKPVVSPLGKMMAFSRLNYGTMQDEINLFSLEQMQEFNLGSVSDPVFHPKDQIVLLSRQYPTANGVKWGLVTYGYGGPNRGKVVELPAALRVDNQKITASFSSDGQMLVMAKPGMGIFASKADFTDSVQLTQNGRDSKPAFTPDGQKILFIRGNRLYAMDKDGANAAVLVPGTMAVREFSFSPDGKQIFFTAVPELIGLPMGG